MLKELHILLMVLLVSPSILAQNNDQPSVPRTVYGITIDGIYPSADIIDAIQSLPVKMTTRIVFDEGQPASSYSSFVNQLSNHSFIMGEILDSYFMKDITVAQYSARVQDYVNTMGSKVDIYEIGNEINGEWLGSNVVEKMTNAYNIVKNAGQKTALTLYYNKNCWANSNNEMFKWTNNNVPASMKQGLDYVWISYYEDDCNNYQPNWQVVFDSLNKIFPNSKIGIGECGTNISSLKASYMQRYYRMNIYTANYVGGYFWWYFRQDCTPKTKPLWNTLKNTIITRTSGPLDVNGVNENDNNNINNPVTFELKQNYPNPFNPSTMISYSIPESGNVKLTVFDIQGREIMTLTNEFLQAGEHTAEFNASSLASGVYLYKIEAGTYSDVKRMMLVK
ncbi:MAG: T9SS C-terminal target domain-containing protein [Ignavibacteriae bacterium]|nr:MAG: T9SS C-terminal target domain-containing protein [Ignavibacteriota bacterium]